MKELSAKEVQQLVEENKPRNIIDVRKDEEVATGVIPGAKHIALGSLPNRLDELDKSQEYIMVCRSGGRSGNACQFLIEQGYKVINMTGGMLAWEGELA
ncbi:rhodanese-like domain-containing protein [Aquibacillus koreensis]|uniref:Rhodanese-like domain-containing protein n=1 Tax=Aquibacillus koreensis TaxID=279446 RepID=A0A9X3WMS5_9BACI|nr:rhodanese-like domain-containing protein [Aquibacillus koreensis]MCT2536756.1 rhodanese-like domain-containing protein [Aquibacillus koreensis]MDC3421488.1 rhodanese-like domain-containing protein [Aquibacillus koreensis]